MKRLMQVCRTIKARINERRLRPFLLFALSGALAIGVWLGWPSLLRSPYVRTPGGAVTLSLSCVPASIEMMALTPYAVLTRAQLVLRKRPVTTV